MSTGNEPGCRRGWRTPRTRSKMHGVGRLGVRGPGAVGHALAQRRGA